MIGRHGGVGHAEFLQVFGLRLDSGGFSRRICLGKSTRTSFSGGRGLASQRLQLLASRARIALDFAYRATQRCAAAPAPPPLPAGLPLRRRSPCGRIADLVHQVPCPLVGHFHAPRGPAGKDVFPCSATEPSFGTWCDVGEMDWALRAVEPYSVHQVARSIITFSERRGTHRAKKQKKLEPFTNKLNRFVSYRRGSSGAGVNYPSSFTTERYVRLTETSFWRR